MSKLINFLSALSFAAICAPFVVVAAAETSAVDITEPAKEAAGMIYAIIKTITPIFRLAGVVMLAFYLIKFIVSMSNGDETQSKTQSIIMIIVSIGLIFWEELLSPLTAIFNNLTS